MKKIHRVFVYGTLKQGQYFHDEYLAEGKSNFLGSAHTTDDYSLYISSLPNMVRERSDTGVKGELYEVDENVLKTLDKLEGHPMMYKREIIDVVDKDGNKKLAWAYLRPLHFAGKKYAHKEIEYV